MSGIAGLCVDNLLDRIKTLPQFATKALHVYQLEELEDRSKVLGYPCIGVIYEGMTGSQASVAGSVVPELSCLILVFVHDRVLGVDQKIRAVDLLDEVRRAINGFPSPTPSPTGHPWVFKMESPIPNVKSDILCYGQRWVTRAPVK